MEVSDKFQLKKQTYNLAVHYVDTYITRSPDFALDKYQLLGITSLLISCKIEEIYFPKISDFEDVTDGKCTSSEIFSMEIQILMKHQWLMNPTTLNNFASYFMLKWDAYAY